MKDELKMRIETEEWTYEEWNLEARSDEE